MVTPYITFNGNCKEALDFYQYVFQSEVTMSRFYGKYVPAGTDNPPEHHCRRRTHSQIVIPLSQNACVLIIEMGRNCWINET